MANSHVDAPNYFQAQNSQVHNDRTISIKISTIWALNKGYIAHFSFFILYA